MVKGGPPIRGEKKRKSMAKNVPFVLVAGLFGGRQMGVHGQRKGKVVRSCTLSSSGKPRTKKTLGERDFTLGLV